LNPIVYNDIFNTQETSSNNDYNVNSQQIRDSENIQSTNNNSSDEPIYSNSTNDTSHSKRQPNKKKREKKSTKQTEISNRKRRKTKQQQNSENEIKSVKDTRTPQNIQRMEGFTEKLNQLIKLKNITDKTIKNMLHKQMLSYANTNKKQNTLSEQWFNKTLSNIKIEYINDFEKSNHLKNDDTFQKLNLTPKVIDSKHSIDELRTYITVEYCIEYFTKTHGLDRDDPLVINMIDILKEKNYTIPMFKQNEQLIYKEAQERIETGEAFDDEDFKFIDDEEDESEIEVQKGETTPSFGRKTHERYVYYWFFVHLLLKCIHDYIKYMKTYEDNEKQVHRARVLYTVWSKKMKRIIENLKNKWNVRITEKTKLSPTKTTNFLKLYRTFVTDYNKKLKLQWKSNSKNSFELKSSNDKSNLGHWFFTRIHNL